MLVGDSSREQLLLIRSALCVADFFLSWKTKQSKRMFLGCMFEQWGHSDRVGKGLLHNWQPSSRLKVKTYLLWIIYKGQSLLMCQETVQVLHHWPYFILQKYWILLYPMSSFSLTFSSLKQHICLCIYLDSSQTTDHINDISSGFTVCWEKMYLLLVITNTISVKSM